MTPFEFRVRSFRMIGSGSVIRTHSDHGRSNEPMNPCLEWTHRFIWSTMIRVISITDTDPDHPKGTHPWYTFCVRSLCPSKLIPQRQVTCHFKSFFFSFNKATVTEKTKLIPVFWYFDHLSEDVGVYLGATFGNGLILTVIARFKSFRTVPNSLVANIAVVDMLNAVIDIPRKLAWISYL